jgi:hypothetical protein
MTDKQRERLNYLLEQVLTEKRSLNKEQLKELHDLIALEIEDLRAKAEKADPKDKFSIVCDVALMKSIQKRVEHEKIKKSIPYDPNFMEKAIAEMNAETEKLRKEREEREYYEAYERRYNSDINNVW